jgi:hypothetical protein
MDKRPHITDGAGFNAMGTTGNEFIIVGFSRQEVEAGNIGDAVDRFMQLTDTPQRVRQLEDCMSFVFLGYENDPRPLHQIPEAVTFFRRVHEQWPYWLHFIEKDADTATRLLWLLCDVKVVSSNPATGMLGFNFADPAAVNKMYAHLCDATKNLYRANGLGGDTYRAMEQRVMRSLERSMA